MTQPLAHFELEYPLHTRDACRDHGAPPPGRPFPKNNRHVKELFHPHLSGSQWLCPLPPSDATLTSTNFLPSAGSRRFPLRVKLRSAQPALTAKCSYALFTFRLLGNQIPPLLTGFPASLLSCHLASLLSSLAEAHDEIQISFTFFEASSFQDCRKDRSVTRNRKNAHLH